MLKKMYTIYDQKAEIYLDPFAFPTHGAALRAFGATVNDTESNIGKNPADYNLFYVGEWDDNSAVFESCSPINLGGGLEQIENAQVPFNVLNAG